MERKDTYALGIAAIDYQHERIFECISNMPVGPSANDILRADAEMARFVHLVQEHCELEEAMMRTLNYPELEQHIEEHRQFQADIHELAQKSLRSKAGVSREAMEVLNKWWTEHIMMTDRQYVHFFADPTLHRRRKKGVRVG